MALTPFEDVLVGATIFGIALIGFFLNVKLISKIRNRASANPDEKVNKLFVNLVFCDLGIILLAFPLPATASFLRNWIWGDLGCTYYGSIAMFFGMHMMITAFMICIDLFLEINIKNYESAKNKTRNIMLAFTWINALLWSLAPFFGWASYGKEPTGFSCTVVLKKDEYFEYTAYMIITAIVCYILPIFVMVICYLSNGTTNTDMSVKEKETFKSKQRKIYLLLILFIIEWAPYTVYYIWPIFNHETVPTRLNAIAPLTAKLATIFTPLVVMNLVDVIPKSTKQK